MRLNRGVGRYAASLANFTAALCAAGTAGTGSVVPAANTVGKVLPIGERGLVMVGQRIFPLMAALAKGAWDALALVLTVGITWTFVLLCCAAAVIWFCAASLVGCVKAALKVRP